MSFLMKPPEEILDEIRTEIAFGNLQKFVEKIRMGISGGNLQRSSWTKSTKEFLKETPVKSLQIPLRNS